MNTRTPRVTLYTAPDCNHCRRARRYLTQQGIRFGEFDVARNQRAWKEFQRWGGRSLPLLLIGETPLFGFDQQRTAKTLRGAGFDV